MPFQIESMELAAGVTVKEGGRVRRGPKRVRTLMYWYSLVKLKIQRNTPPSKIKKTKKSIFYECVFFWNESFYK